MGRRRSHPSNVFQHQAVKSKATQTKKMKRFIQALLVLILSFGILEAASSEILIPTLKFPSSIPEIKNSGAFRAEVLGRVIRAELSVYSPTIISNSQNVTSFEAAGASPNEILAELSSKVFSFQVYNPQDEISVWVSLLDKDWNQVGGAGKNVKLEKVSSSFYRLPQITLEPALWRDQPIKVGDATEAKVVRRDENGEVVDIEYLGVQDGKIYLSMDVAGENGELILSGWDKKGNGFSVAYSLNSGNRTSPLITEGQVGFSMRNYSEISDTGLVEVQFGVKALGSEDSIDAPLSRVKLMTEKTVSFTAEAVDERGVKIETPLKAYAISPEGLIYNVSESRNGNETKFSVRLGAGVWFIFFDWPSLFNPEPPTLDWREGKG